MHKWAIPLKWPYFICHLYTKEHWGDFLVCYISIEEWLCWGAHCCVQRGWINFCIVIVGALVMDLVSDNSAWLFHRRVIVNGIFGDVVGCPPLPPIGGTTSSLGWLPETLVLFGVPSVSMELFWTHNFFYLGPFKLKFGGEVGKNILDIS